MTILDLVIWRGTDFGPARLLFVTEEGGPPYSLTGWQFFAQIRKDIGGELILDLTPVVHDAEGGEVRFSIARSVTAGLPLGRYKWDMIAQKPDGTRMPEPFYGGDVTIKQAITQ